MRYAGTTTAGVEFRANGWPLTAKKTWSCDICAETISPGDTYVRIDALVQRHLCLACALSAKTNGRR
jgi:hypothetical protein